MKITVELGPVTGRGRHSKSRYMSSRVGVRYPRQVLLPSGPRVNCDEWTSPPPPRPLQQQLRRTRLLLPPSATMYLQLQHH